MRVQHVEFRRDGILWGSFKDGWPNLFIENVKQCAGRDGKSTVRVVGLVYSSGIFPHLPPLGPTVRIMQGALCGFGFQSLPGPIFMAMLTVSKKLALMEAGNFAFTHGLAGNFCLYDCTLVTKQSSLTQQAQKMLAG